jgi:DNA replication protein DnaC
MTTVVCTICGGSFEREIPEELTGIFRDLLERTPPVCDGCTERANGEQERSDAEQHQRDNADRVLQRQQASGIPEELPGLRLARLLSDTRDDIADALTRVAVGELSGLVLAGPVGVGKTHLAAAAAWQLLERRPVRWMFVPTLFARLALSFASENREHALETLASSTGLVLDDLDKARPTEYAAEQLFGAIDNRVTAGTPLLITTNLQLDELAKRFPQPHGEAIASRLAQHCELFALEGRDRRMERFAS